MNADEYISTGQGFFGNNVFAYVKNNPIQWSDESGKLAKPISYIIFGDENSEAENSWALQHSKKVKGHDFIQRKDKRKNSEQRQPGNLRECNIGHKNGEEYSVKPKGNGMPIKHFQRENAFGKSLTFAMIPCAGGVALMLMMRFDYDTFHI